MPDEKMKYPLLEFKYDKKPYEELLTLNPHPGFMDRVSIVTEDYEHDDFGRLPGDDKNALGHAAGVLLKLHKHCFGRKGSTCTNQKRLTHKMVQPLIIFS